MEQKSAIITGISKGIGKAVALKLLDEGMTVVGWGRTKPDYSHQHLHFITCDVADEKQVADAYRQTLEITGKIDLLLNNAGFGYFAPIESFDSDQFRRMFEVNVFGTYYCTKVVAAAMKKRGSGHIINISSIAGRTGMPQGEGYNSSKFAVAGFSECLFNELRQDQVKVTCIYPGSVETDFFNEIPNFEAHSNMLQPQDVAETVWHIFNSPPNYLIREIEIRPLVSKPPLN